MSYYFYGIRAVIVAGVSVLSSVFADYLCVTAMRKKYDWGDMSPVMSGLLLALLMPASVPYTIMAFSAAFMAIVCKHAFGGNKNLIFCPVCIAYIFTIFCFPAEIVRYPVPAPFGSVSLSNIVTDRLVRSYTYYLDNGSSSTFSLLDIIWGKLAGPMGASAILIILISAVALYFFRDIPTIAFFAGFGANVLINVLFPVGETGWYAVLNSLVAGSYLFVLVFMACDPRYVPKRAFSQLVYGCLFAGISYLIRLYTNIENSTVFALPILCIFRDEFDRLSDALERFLAFLRKWTGIISSFVWKYIKIGASVAFKYTKSAAIWLAKNIAKGFDGLCDIISDKIVEAGKKIKDERENKKKSEPDTPKAEDENTKESEKEPEASENNSENSKEAEQ